MLAIADLKLAEGGGKDWACGTVVQLRQGSESKLGLLAGGAISRDPSTGISPIVEKAIYFVG
jgi:hypothetical protein